MKKWKVYTRRIIVDCAAGTLVRSLGVRSIGFMGTEQRAGKEVWVYSVDVSSPLHAHAMKQEDAEVLVELVREAGFNARFVDHLLTECYRSDYPGLDWSALIPDGGKYLEE